MTRSVSPPWEIDPKQVSPGALRTFLSISEAWELSSDEIAAVLGVDRAQCDQWKASPEQVVLPHKNLERISCVFGMFRALNTIFSDRVHADSWIKQPNTGKLFNGQSALSLLVSPNNNDLLEVRKYLDGVVGGSEEDFDLYQTRSLQTGQEEEGQ